MTLVLPDAMAELEPKARAIHEALAAQPCAISASDFHETLRRDFPEVARWMCRGEASTRTWLIVLQVCGWVRHEVSTETGDLLYIAEKP